VSGATAQRRLTEWRRSGVFARLREALDASDALDTPPAPDQSSATEETSWLQMARGAVAALSSPEGSPEASPDARSYEQPSP
jgi:hypothetical protein